MMWMTIYLDWWSENSKIIEAEWCANTLNGEIQNFLFYTLTSKQLRVQSWSDYIEVSPKSYYIYMTWGKDHKPYTSHAVCIESSYNSASDTYCDTIALAYHETGYGQDRHVIDQYNYKLLSSANCSQTKNVKLLFHWDWELSSIWMNKWFSQLWQDKTKPFYVKTITSAEWKELSTWWIIILACMAWGDECLKSQRKEIWKREVDTRSQTITLKKCKFYEEDNKNKCKEREK